MNRAFDDFTDYNVDGDDADGDDRGNDDDNEGNDHYSSIMGTMMMMI